MTVVPRMSAFPKADVQNVVVGAELDGCLCSRWHGE